MPRNTSETHRRLWIHADARKREIETRTESWRSLNPHKLDSAIYRARSRPLLPDELQSLLQLRSDDLVEMYLTAYINLIIVYSTQILILELYLMVEEVARLVFWEI